MSKSNNAFIKKQKELKRKKKRQDKLEKMNERKKIPKDGVLENMLAYVDEIGNITTTPPEIRKTDSSNK